MTKLELAKCPLCKSPSDIFLQNRPDYECNLTTKFQYFKCVNNRCGHVSASVPEGFNLASLYQEYSTHHKHVNRDNGLVLKLTPSKFQKDKLDWKKALSSKKLDQIKVLDFGCGNGAFINKLKCYGSANVYAYDFDEKALKVAEKEGANIIRTLDGSEKFDVIFLNHVIEHIAQPLNLIKILKDKLNPDGVIYIVTPNNASLIQKLFGVKWRGWETPRHVNIFNKKSALKLISLSQFPKEKCSVYTINGLFFGIYHESFVGSFWKSKIGKLLRWSLFIPFSWLAYMNSIITDQNGEEVVIILRD